MGQPVGVGQVAHFWERPGEGPVQAAAPGAVVKGREGGALGGAHDRKRAREQGALGREHEGDDGAGREGEGDGAGGEGGGGGSGRALALNCLWVWAGQGERGGGGGVSKVKKQ